MGALYSTCASAKHVAAAAMPDFMLGGGSDDGPDVTDDDRSTSAAREMLRRISTLCSPVTVARGGEHNVNFARADRLSEQRSLPRQFRRTTSFTPPIQGTAECVDDIWTPGRKELEFNIHKERGKDHEDPQPDLLSQEDRLRRRLGKLKMDMNVVRGDGNCLFRAISQELWETEEYHISVRRKAVRHMREHKEDFEGFLGQEFGSYCTTMERPGTWGDELTLRAVCDAYGVIVNVVTSDQLNWFMRYMPALLLHAKEIFLTYVSPVHYNTIRRKEPLRALKPALSLTRKSIIQEAIDKADKAQRDMRSIPSIPEARSMGTRSSLSKTSSDAQSQPTAVESPFAAAAASGKGGPDDGQPPASAAAQASGSFRTASSSSFRSAGDAASSPPLPKSEAREPNLAASSPGPAADVLGQDQQAASPLQAHPLSFRSRGSATSSAGSPLCARSQLGSLAESADEGRMDSFTAAGARPPGLPASVVSSSSAATAALHSQRGFVLPGQVPAPAPGAAAAAVPDLVSHPAEASMVQQNGHGSAGGGGAVQLAADGGAQASAAGKEYRTATTGVVMASEESALDAVLSGKSLATDPGALKELLELDPVGAVSLK